MRYLFIALCLACLPQVVFADTKISASVDKTSITTDDIVTYTLSVTSSEKIIPNPVLPSLAHFSVVSQQQSSNFSFGKDGIVTSITLKLALAPVDAGTFTIDPAQIKVKNQVLKSGTFTIEVKQGTARPQAPPQEQFPEEPQTTL